MSTLRPKKQELDRQEAELSRLIARSIELNTECLSVKQRIRELNEQVSQLRRNPETGEEKTPG